MSEKAKEFRVEFSLTVNLGNYNSARIGCALDDCVEPGEEFETKFDQVYQRVRHKVRSALADLTHEVRTVTNEGAQNG